MTDRELLELAAKAAGYNVRWHDRWAWFVHVGPHNIDNPPIMAGQRHVWSPLTDRGDALKLAVKFRMGIHYETQFINGKDVEIVEVYYSHNEEDQSSKVVAEIIGDSADAATMRAIVRAAAEIQLQKDTK